jgi:FAD/FMN-containing dehydrogenase
MQLSSTQISTLRDIVGPANVLTDEAFLLKYGHDETEDYVFPPAVVVKPRTVEEVSQIMRFATAQKIPGTRGHYASFKRDGRGKGAILSSRSEQYGKLLDWWKRCRKCWRGTGC